MGDDDHDLPWPNLLENLKARDINESVLDAVITDYEALHEVYRTERKAAIQLRQDLDGLRQRPSLTTDVAMHNLDLALLSEENRERLKSMEGSLIKLQEELAKAYSVIHERDRALSASHKQQQEDECHIEKLNTEVEILMNKVQEADDKIKRLSEENERSKHLESWDSLQERCRKLEQENELMLARMKELSDQRSDAMNEMNEIVQRTKSLLIVKTEVNENASEASCRILDPDAWAKILNDPGFLSQDPMTPENDSCPSRMSSRK